MSRCDNGLPDGLCVRSRRPTQQIHTWRGKSPTQHKSQIREVRRRELEVFWLLFWAQPNNAHRKHKLATLSARRSMRFTLPRLIFPCFVLPADLTDSLSAAVSSVKTKPLASKRRPLSTRTVLWNPAVEQSDLSSEAHLPWLVSLGKKGESLGVATNCSSKKGESLGVATNCSSKEIRYL
jgi:hypothetical protein